MTCSQVVSFSILLIALHFLSLGSFNCQKLSLLIFELFISLRWSVIQSCFRPHHYFIIFLFFQSQWEAQSFENVKYTIKCMKWLPFSKNSNAIMYPGLSHWYNYMKYVWFQTHPCTTRPPHIIIYVHIWKITFCDIAHLSVPDHNHADEDNVDVGSQRFVVVDFIHLKGNQSQPLSLMWTLEKKKHLMKVIENVFQYWFAEHVRGNNTVKAGDLSLRLHRNQEVNCRPLITRLSI